MYWVPIIAVIVSIFALFYQIRHSRFALGVELLQKQDERFNSDEFYQKRMLAVKSIQSKSFIDAEEIYDFFETIGLLLRRRALDKEFVWSSFYWWIHRYWYVSKAYVERRRIETHDLTLWQDFEYLAKKLNKYEKKKRKATSDSILILTDDELKAFYDAELSLEGD
jgi:hypothetical protein